RRDCSATRPRARAARQADAMPGRTLPASLLRAAASGTLLAALRAGRHKPPRGRPLRARQAGPARCSSGWFEPAGQRLRLVPPASIRSSSAFKDRRCFRTVSSTVYIGWLSLHPPRRGRLVANHDLIQERGGLGKPFVGRHESVLVLDG